MTSSLLEVRKLTMRFGGLTAVNQVDFAVRPGEIFSVIGPNGAGKTTVFNAVTGVYEPTEGEIRFEGRDLRRPFRSFVVAGVAGVGLLTGILLALLSSDIDGLWRTAITLNYPDASEPFPVRKAFRDGLAHLSARIVPERDANKLTNIEVVEREGQYRIRSTTNKTVLEVLEDADQAEKRREVLQSLIDLEGSVRSTKYGEGRWLAHADFGTTLHDSEESARIVKPFTVEPAPSRWHVLDSSKIVLETFDSLEAARQRLMDLAIRTGKLRWKLVTRVSPQVLGTASTPEAAKGEAAKLEELILLGPAAPLEERDGKIAALSADRSRILAVFADREQARERLEELAPLKESMAGARALIWVFLVAGIALGAGGTLAVWSRSRRTPDRIARCGLARTFQNIRLFPDMLVIENVLMGMDTRIRASHWGAALRTPGFRRAEEEARGRASELLKFVGLDARAHDLARGLPYGAQRRLEIARALATEPRLLLLDEPAAGMNPAETVELMALIRRIRDRGVTVLLIEHHMRVVMGISDRIAVLDYGSKIAEGTPEEVKSNPRVIEAYLGKEEVG